MIFQPYENHSYLTKIDKRLLVEQMNGNYYYENIVLKYLFKVKLYQK